MAAFEAWLVFLILVVNVVGELQRKRTLAASRGFLAAARLSCFIRMLHKDAYSRFRPVIVFLSFFRCVLSTFYIRMYGEWERDSARIAEMRLSVANVLRCITRRRGE